MKPSKPVILYVDDEPSNLVSFTAAFRRHYTIYTAKSAKEGIEILRREPVHLIITDQRMPEMTGVQFLEAIIPEYPDSMRMILTGFSDVEAIIKAINSGRVLRYITKPWEEAELKQILDGALIVYDLERRNRELLANLQEEIAKQQSILNIFKKYVPEDVVKETLAAGDDNLTYSEGRIVSISFCDIRRFSALAERLTPAEIVKLLNNFFTAMSLCIKKNKGFVNKFLGDGILSIFGAPISSLDNQANAVMCGLEMLQIIKDFNNSPLALDTNISIGIGIHTGDVVVGNIGSSERIEYTAVGDAVNVACRIEELTHDEENCLLISETTYEATKDLIDAEDLGLQTIRGREEKVKVYKVIGLKSPI
ncbi:MAG: response regulator [Parachlamydia sp.]|jgi:class 3 adenylate cyclase|nr:response regulator [Parachlamydia sp.]